MQERVAALADAIRDADTAVAFTGAGVSTPSGVPDFRSDGGLWERYDPSAFTRRGFDDAPAAFWRTWRDIADEVGLDGVEPNDAHRALADMVAEDAVDAVVTQNADGLHQDAGTPDDAVLELHGSTRRAVCGDCGRRRPTAALDLDDPPPLCQDCGGTMEPDVVLFGDRLPEHALYRAQALAEESDVFVVAGSSLTVEPAAGLPRTAAGRGASLAVVNRDPTPLDDRADHVFREDVVDVLPALRDATT